MMLKKKIWLQNLSARCQNYTSDTIILFLLLFICFNTRGIELKPVLNTNSYDGARVLESEVGRAATREEKGDEEVDVLEIFFYRIYKLLTSLSSDNSPSIRRILHPCFYPCNCRTCRKIHGFSYPPTRIRVIHPLRQDNVIHPFSVIITPAISSVTSATSYGDWGPTIPEPGHNS